MSMDMWSDHLETAEDLFKFLQSIPQETRENLHITFAPDEDNDETLVYAFESVEGGALVQVFQFNYKAESYE